MPARPLVAVALAAVAASTALPALAQYQWRDENGRMVFSDRPPPASVPPASVLRSPRAGASQAPGSETPATPAAGARSLAEREMEFRRRRLEREESERKAAEQRERSERNARACEDARGALRTLETGRPVTRIDASGERVYLDDEERARRADQLRQDLRELCGP